MALTRSVEPSLETSSWKRGTLPAELTRWASAPSRDVDVAEALLFLAWLTWPPDFIGCSLAESWAWLRYLPALAVGPDLCLRNEWKELDPHQKTVLSDDFGVGVTASVLSDLLGFVDFADTRWALAHALKGVVALKGPVRGPKKSPDFLVVDAHGRLSVLECKGTQTSRGALRRAMQTGKLQKKQTRSLGSVAFRHKLVAGIFVPVVGRASRPELRIADPSWLPLERAMRSVSPEAIVLAVRRVSLGKQLAAAGFVSSGSVLTSEVEGTAASLRAATLLDLGRTFQPESRTDEVSQRLPAEGFTMTRAMLVPPGRQMATEYAVREMRYSARVPRQVVTELLAAENIDSTVQRLAAAQSPQWSRGGVDTLHRLVSPAGIEFTLEIPRVESEATGR